MTTKEKNKMIELLNRTYSNCLYYKERNKEYSLANEIGVLRGIAYCLSDVAGICPHNGDFMEMIEIQQLLTEKDEVLMLVNNELTEREKHPHLKNDFLVTIIDNIEDWLDEKGVVIPNEDRDSESEHNPASIYGMDFDWMMNMLRDVCAANGIIVDDEWEG